MTHTKTKPKNKAGRNGRAKKFESAEPWKMVSRAEVKRHVLGPDVPIDFRGHRFFASEHIIEDLPLFTLYTARLMVQDPVVQFGLAVRDAALSHADIIIASSSDAVSRFIRQQFNRIWQNHRHMIMRTRRYGYLGFQVSYRVRKDGKLAVDRLQDFDPHSVRALMSGGGIVGFRFKSRARHSHSLMRKQRLLAPRGLWCSFDSEGGNPYGQPILKRSYAPWWEKWMEHGAKKTSQLRMMKDAFLGLIGRYPENRKMKFTKEDGTTTTVEARDIIREMTENALSGANFTLPSDSDSLGNRKFDIERMKDAPAPTGLWDWEDRLDKRIWFGLDVPEEVIQAADTGSGFSGRSIPFMVFLGCLTTEFEEYLRCVIRDILKPLVWLNFGSEAEFEIKPKNLVETLAELIGGSGLGGGAIGGAGGQVPGAPGDKDMIDPSQGGGAGAQPSGGPRRQPAAPRQPSGPFITVQGPSGPSQRKNPNFGKAQQFAEFDESKVKRERKGAPEGGRFAAKEGTDIAQPEGVSSAEDISALEREFVDQWAAISSIEDQKAFDRKQAEVRAWVDDPASSPEIEAIYQSTQGRLASQGITQVESFRGVTIPKDHPLAKAVASGQLTVGSNATINGMKAVSYSEQLDVAGRFASPFSEKAASEIGVIFRRRIPAEDIIASHRTQEGFFRGEDEIVAKSKAKPQMEIAAFIIDGKVTR